MKHRTYAGRTAWTLGLTAVLLVAACSGNQGVQNSSASPNATSTPFDSTALAALAQASVVFIKNDGTITTSNGSGERADYGSGFVVDPAGYVVTNDHVIAGSAYLTVQVGTDPTLRNADVVGVSECSDLAVLKIAGTFPALSLATNAPKLGEEIYVAGYPDPTGYPNGDVTLTNGIVSKQAIAADTAWASVQQQFESGAVTSEGNSGSPVLDQTGQVVGIEYAGSNDTGGSFAIASSEAKGIIDQIISTKRNFDSIGLNGLADGSGIAISAVIPGSPADNVGIKAGDLLTIFDGSTVGTDGTLAE